MAARNDDFPPRKIIGIATINSHSFLGLIETVDTGTVLTISLDRARCTAY